MHPLALDFETTGKDPNTANPLEVAFASAFDKDLWGSRLIALPKGKTIPPESSAVHHIIESDLVDAGDYNTVLQWLIRELTEAGSGSLDGIILVAHNSEYEQAVLTQTDLHDLPWVCTMKCAMRIWPDAPSFGNEALRYFLELDDKRGRGSDQKPHSALHDAKITALLFRRLMEHVTVEEMIRWTREPAQIPRCPIGEHYGKPWSEVPEGFLKWMINKPIDREDAIICARKELARRRALPSNPIHVPV